MAARHVVVDGSNLATEGRSMPSLAQLDQAVREFLLENPEDVVTVVVDASFGHRIDGGEFTMFEEAEAAGELVSPPAGAIGRGDAFLLRIADKTGATVLSNDSFQEFHGDYDWLFERGRLIGGKPVPGVGWIFTPRTPVRGPRSREAVKEAKRKTKGETESAMPGLDLAAERSRTKGKGRKNVERAIAVALEEVVAPKDKPRRRRKGGTPPADPLNDPLSFITFIAAHRLGAEVTATVDSFASHGAFVDCEGARCYVPLSAMGEPPPKSAREIFAKGEEVTFVVQALDPQRRGVELALPSFAKIAGAPTEETVAAEIEAAEGDSDTTSGASGARGAAAADETTVSPPARRSRKKAAPAVPIGSESDEVAAPAKKAPSRRRGPAVGDAGTATAPAAAAATTAAAAALVGPAPSATEAPAMKAAPRRRGRSGAVATPPPGAIASAPDETPTDAAVTKAAASRPSSRRRTASGSAPGPGGAAVLSEPSPDVAASEAAPTKAAPRKRGRPGTAASAPPVPDAVAPAPAPALPQVAEDAPLAAPRGAVRSAGSRPGRKNAAPVPAANDTPEAASEPQVPLRKAASRGGRGAVAVAPPNSLGAAAEAVSSEAVSSEEQAFAPPPAPAKRRAAAPRRSRTATAPDDAAPTGGAPTPDSVTPAEHDRSSEPAARSPRRRSPARTSGMSPSTEPEPTAPAAT